MNNIYTPEGWINVPAIAERDTWLKVLIGARQVGKTYGTLKYHLDNKIPFILMRRTKDELELIADNSELDPFKAFEPEYHCKMFKAGKSYIIMDYDADGKSIPGTQRGLAMSLPQIAHVRGFNGSGYSSVILDEAVPEKGVRVLKSEGDSVLNAYVTISGNRELEGKPPLTLWLLSNTNNINSPILESLNLMDDIIKMQTRGIEFYEHDGMSMFYGKSTRIIEKRKQTVLAKQVREDSAFSQMAYDNKWAYDDSPVIKPRSITGLTPLCSYDNRLYFWEGANSIYCCAAKHNTEKYGNSDFERAQFVGNYKWLLRWYAEKMVTFADIKLLAIFKRLFDIDY